MVANESDVAAFKDYTPSADDTAAAAAPAADTATSAAPAQAAPAGPAAAPAASYPEHSVGMHTTRTPAHTEFSMAAPSVWNSLPSDIRFCNTTVTTFMRHLTTHLFSQTAQRHRAPQYLLTL